MLVGWYLRRAIPWMALLGCCAAAVAVTVALDRWPTAATVLLPGVVACCAAAAAFTFDEASLPVVEVTPRGATWRRAARLVAAGVPLLVLTAMVLVRPGDLPLDRRAWFVVGLAAVSLTAGLAALASRRAVTAPGGSLAAGVVLAVISPVVVGAFLDWGSLYPIGEFGSAALAIWLGIACAGALACFAGVRPRVRG